MMLEEANARLKTVQIDSEQLALLSPLYIALDIDKSDFCKFVDAVGIEKVMENTN